MPVRLVALDLDGTALGPDGQLSPAVRAAVADALAAGLHVVLATGRRYLATYPFAAQLGLRDPVVVQNGALLVDPTSGQILHQQTIPAPAAAAAILAGRQLDLDLGVVLGPAAGEAILRERLPRSRRGQSLARSGTPVPSLLGALSPPGPLKISGFGEPDRLAAWLGHLSEAVPGQLQPIAFDDPQGQLVAVELLPAGCSKASGLERVLRNLGIPWSQVLAVGDDYNDLPLLRQAGVPLAMANARPACQEVAVAVVPSHGEDGVAVALRQYALADRRPA